MIARIAGFSLVLSKQGDLCFVTLEIVYKFVFLNLCLF